MVKPDVHTTDCLNTSLGNAKIHNDAINNNVVFFLFVYLYANNIIPNSTPAIDNVFNTCERVNIITIIFPRYLPLYPLKKLLYLSIPIVLPQAQSSPV